MRAALRGEVDQEKFNEVMDWFLGEIQTWPDQEEADEAYGIVHQEAQRLDKEIDGFTLEVVDDEEEATAVGESEAVSAMEKGETALGDEEVSAPKDEQELPAHVLPSGFPGFGKLREAGLDTPKDVEQKLKRGTLQEIDGIGPATEAEIKNALEDMRKGEGGLFGDG